MLTHKSKKRAPFHHRNCARFFFLFILLIDPLTAQSDSGYTFHISSGSSYFDIFRQRSINSRTIAFSKESFAYLAAMSGKESLSVAIRTFEHYAAVNQYRSKFTSSFSNELQTIGLLYANSLSFFNYLLELTAPLNTSSMEMKYRVSIGVDPFNGLLDAGISLQRNPFQYTTALTFQDFIVPFRDLPPITTVSYTIRSKPFSDFRTEIDYIESDGTDFTISNLYGMNFDFHSFGKKIAVHYTFLESSSLTAEIETEEYRTELTFKKNNISFGDFVDGSGKHSRYMAGILTKVFGTPISAEYSFGQLSVAGLGQVESWPFTTLAASIITNKLNYQLSGTLKHHALATSADFVFETSTLTTKLSYHRILPDAVIEHWEPEFLVFGMKNFTRTPFSISDIHLVGLGVQYQVSFDRFTISALLDQYIPLSITYRKSIPSITPAPGVPSSVSSTPKTDGGRKAAIILSVSL
ncbi:MAG: hypothetical protein WDA22_02945 [Bacteroidota bacterium]